LLDSHKDYSVTRILTRSSIEKRDSFYLNKLLTNSVDELIESSDLIVECSGDVIYATDMIAKILEAGIPVVTMNSEFHVTVGSYFINKGLVTEAEGDQPGALAVLHEEALAMGFEPLVYGNIKGFLNHYPTPEDMNYWSKRSGISLDMVTSFTDGTKVQIEQAFVANGFGATIAQDGLMGVADDDMNIGGSKLALRADELKYPISDYLLSPKLPAGVFLVAKHSLNQKNALKYYKMGEGPYYVLERPFHLCHLEIIKTIRRVLNGGGSLLDNGKYPTISVATIAKRDLDIGDNIKKGIGSFDVRGEAVKIDDYLNHVPIGLIADVTLKRKVSKGEIITFDDLDMPDTLALKAWKYIVDSTVKNRSVN
jgi:predicted homoserine dehydrogenase-like protein